jgi:hypothetical protein
MGSESDTSISIFTILVLVDGTIRAVWLLLVARFLLLLDEGDKRFDTVAKIHISLVFVGPFLAFI